MPIINVYHDPDTSDELLAALAAALPKIVVSSLGFHTQTVVELGHAELRFFRLTMPGKRPITIDVETWMAVVYDRGLERAIALDIRRTDELRRIVGKLQTGVKVAYCDAGWCDSDLPGQE